nr:hypothetical protein [Tanacetum cinerariifolium]
MQQTLNELMAFCTSLQRQHSELVAKFQAQEVEINRLKDKVKNLEDQEGVIGENSRDDAPIKGRRETNVPTGSGFILTAGLPATIVTTGSEVSPTASPIVQRRKGKEIMVKSDTPKKEKLQEQIDAQMARELEEQQEKEDLRMNEQIARDAEVARIHTEEEIQGMIDSLEKLNETVAKYLQEYQQFASDLSLEKKIELISDLVKSDWRKSGDDASIKGRSSNEGEAAAEGVSNDSEEIARVLTSLDAANVLAGETNVPTGSGSIPTTGPPATIVTTGSEVGTTASPIVQKRKGKEIMVESDTPKKKKLQ